MVNWQRLAGEDPVIQAPDESVELSCAFNASEWEWCILEEATKAQYINVVYQVEESAYLGEFEVDGQVEVFLWDMITGEVFFDFGISPAWSPRFLSSDSSAGILLFSEDSFSGYHILRRSQAGAWLNEFQAFASEHSPKPLVIWGDSVASQFFSVFEGKQKVLDDLDGWEEPRLMINHGFSGTSSIEITSAIECGASDYNDAVHLIFEDASAVPLVESAENLMRVSKMREVTDDYLLIGLGIYRRPLATSSGIKLRLNHNSDDYVDLVQHEDEMERLLGDRWLSMRRALIERADSELPDPQFGGRTQGDIILEAGTIPFQWLAMKGDSYHGPIEFQHEYDEAAFAGYVSSPSELPVNELGAFMYCVVNAKGDFDGEFARVGDILTWLPSVGGWELTRFDGIHPNLSAHDVFAEEIAEQTYEGLRRKELSVDTLSVDSGLGVTLNLKSNISLSEENLHVIGSDFLDGDYRILESDLEEGLNALSVSPAEGGSRLSQFYRVLLH